mmetsp:Transcript_8393/g.14991  ORF Transcript_8393/g.14991 Transcript_8393/m.14991 type:complete len:299 (+) Transcript_8393:1844-2740(+)
MPAPQDGQYGLLRVHLEQLETTKMWEMWRDKVPADPQFGLSSLTYSHFSHLTPGPHCPIAPQMAQNGSKQVTQGAQRAARVPKMCAMRPQWAAMCPRPRSRSSPVRSKTIWSRFGLPLANFGPPFPPRLHTLLQGPDEAVCLHLEAQFCFNFPILLARRGNNTPEYAPCTGYPTVKHRSKMCSVVFEQAEICGKINQFRSVLMVSPPTIFPYCGLWTSSFLMGAIVPPNRGSAEPKCEFAIVNGFCHSSSSGCCGSDFSLECSMVMLDPNAESAFRVLGMRTKDWVKQHSVHLPLGGL